MTLPLGTYIFVLVPFLSINKHILFLFLLHSHTHTRIHTDTHTHTHTQTHTQTHTRTHTDTHTYTHTHTHTHIYIYVYPRNILFIFFLKTNIRTHARTHTYGLVAHLIKNLSKLLHTRVNTYIHVGGSLSVTIIDVEKRISSPSSSPGGDRLRFTSR